MTVVTVLYPATEGATFDHEYYTGKHMPMVERLWAPMGMTVVRVLRGVPGPDGKGPPFVVMTSMEWPDAETFGTAAQAHGAEIFRDIRNFTNIRAQTQVSEG